MNQTQPQTDYASLSGASTGTPAPYREKLLTIKTPVTVVLAEKKETLRNILSLVPGSMLTFDTHCDHPLELSVGGHVIANGETVKIGDKFGIRIRQVGVEKPE
ncbi:FliM/FliN family flagellar motor switch protein [Neorhodopirellula pilleata]|uniref:Flagellar motor switch protein FliN n=1 Tax=Neorhodopirellula pilleata TaxID=2714738 RepID=A0A5C6A6M7_9BACT|nr:FliM/FliN family flagellar motor switch protein [Neorhodopirellula pilleata]TWT95632.1 Flagellar motor switch protein FliN [Neorhodopirellula pilleata]